MMSLPDSSSKVPPSPNTLLVRCPCSQTAVAGFKTGRRALSFELFGSTGADKSESLMSPYEGSKRYDKGGLDYCIEIEIDNSKVIRVDNAAKDMKTYNQGSQSALGKWATSCENSHAETSLRLRASSQSKIWCCFVASSEDYCSFSARKTPCVVFSNRISVAVDSCANFPLSLLAEETMQNPKP